MGVAGGPDMIENGLVLSLDASDRNSYVSGSTTWFDLSGNNNSGSLVNGPTFNTGSLGSIVFDGVDDYVNIPDNFNLEVVPFTFSCWIKTSQSGTRGTISFKYSSLTFEKGWFLSNLTDGKLRAWIGSSPLDYRGKDTALSYNNGNWYNVCMRVLDYNTVEIYINSIQSSYSTTWSRGNVTTLDTTEPLQIGGNTNYNQYINGNISNILYYNRALSSDEILQNYNATKARFGL